MQSSPSRLWTESDGQLLRSLREAAGLEAAAFAYFCALSKAQLAELEEGGHGRFYNDRIKANTGRKLLKRLGHVPVEPLPPPDAESAHEPALASRPALRAARRADASLLGNPWLLRAVIAVAGVATLVVILMPRATREPPHVAAIPSAQAATPAQQEPMAPVVPVQPTMPGAAQAPATTGPATPATASPSAR